MNGSVPVRRPLPGAPTTGLCWPQYKIKESALKHGSGIVIDHRGYNLEHWGCEIRWNVNVVVVVVTGKEGSAIKPLNGPGSFRYQLLRLTSSS